MRRLSMRPKSSAVETENGGWLVADYWHPQLHDLTHTSLNHLAAECLAAYHLADLLQDESLRETADKLLAGTKKILETLIGRCG